MRGQGGAALFRHDADQTALTTPSANPPGTPSFPAPLQVLFATACGVLVANIYYAQPLIALIAPDLRIGDHAAGVVVMAAQLGYAAALLLLTPLADIVENRRLVLCLTAMTVVALLGAGFAQSAPLFLACSFVVGAGSTGAQVLVPLASHLVPPHARGRVIGNIVAGLLAGIMLARPLASFVASHFGWRAIFFLSSGMTALMGLMLLRALPSRRPEPGLRFGPMLLSIGRLFATHPVFRRRTACHTLAFAAFQLFWTAIPLALADRLGLTQSGIALFALAGAGGALCAPLAGRLADRGYTRSGIWIAMASIVGAFALAGWAGAALSVAGLVISAILLDAAVQANLVMSQRVIYGLDPAARGRLNAGFMTSIFIGGAAGSFLGALIYASAGWAWVAATGAALGGVALLLLALEHWRTPNP